MYLLDTNTISELMKQNQQTWQKMLSCQRQVVFLCEVVIAEILFGLKLLKNSKRKQLLQREFTSLRKTLPVLPWDGKTSEIFAEIKSDLSQKGRMITDLDIAIAAHALRYQYVLVTDNKKDFQRIAELEIVNWKER